MTWDRFALAAFLSIGLAGSVLAVELPEEVRQSIKVTTQYCSGKVTFKQGFIVHVNALGSGTNDFLLNYGAIVCDDSESYFCGTGGCTTQLFVRLEDGTFRKVLDATVRNVTFARKHGMPAMTIDLHGTSCGKTGVDPCSETLYWNGMEFSPAHLQ